MIDSHCHLDMDAYQQDLPIVINDAQRQGIGHIITIGINYSSSQQAVAIAEKHPNISATIGVHPHDATEVNNRTLEKMAALADSTHVVAYGEIGLDYVKHYSPREIQLTSFQTQLHIAKELQLPLVIHDREAHEDTLQLLREVGPFPSGGVMHCFSGDTELARQVIDLGFMISIPGVVTFKNATTLQHVVRSIDLRHMLLETDGPFLAPVPYRGKRNTPSMLLHTAQTVATLKDLQLDDVASVTTANTKKLFLL